MRDSLPVTDRFLKIPAAEGRVLSARLWRPDVPGRYPAILEFSPYRVWDTFRGLGEAIYPGWAQHGYVVISVDIAGSGASTGLLHDEYLKSEIDDALAVMEWCSRQDWCDGAIGLTGGSWAAFAALRLSDRKPAGLKAMVLGGVSEDGWHTDIHLLGGLPYCAQVDWAATMQMFNAMPPDPLQFGDGWREAWKTRLAYNRPWVETWLSHPAHDDYWKGKASTLSSNVPLLLYNGFADKYAISVLRIAERWQGPVRTILGPWEHMFPNLAARKPRIDFVAEALRWWDRWLKGRETGVLDESPLRCFIGAPDYKGSTEAGHWRALDWPLTGNAAMNLAERNGVLVADAAPGGDWQQPTVVPPWPAKLTSDLYEDVPGPFDLAAFARAGALFASSEPTQRDLDIVGVPLLRCTVRSNGPGGTLIARLIDEAPGGTTIRMTTAALALSEAGDIMLPFQACAWRLRRGHRLVLVLCANGAPNFWPPRGGLSVAVKNVRLEVPYFPSLNRDETGFAPAVPPPLATEKLKWIDRAEEPIAYPRLANAAAHETVSAAHHLPGTGTDYYIASRFEVANLDDGARTAKSYRIAFERPGFSIRIDTRLDVTSSTDRYRISWAINARDGGKPFHSIGATSEIAKR